jgi:hypothetical protein
LTAVKEGVDRGRPHFEIPFHTGTGTMKRIYQLFLSAIEREWEERERCLERERDDLRERCLKREREN